MPQEAVDAKSSQGLRAAFSRTQRYSNRQELSTSLSTTWSEARRELGKVLHALALLLHSPLASLDRGQCGAMDLRFEPLQPPWYESGEPRSISRVRRLSSIPLRVPASSTRSPCAGFAAQRYQPTPQTGSSAWCNEILHQKELFWLLFTSLADLDPSRVTFCGERGGTCFKINVDTLLLPCSFVNPPAGT